MDEKQITKEKKQKHSFSYYFGGGLLNEDFFIRHSKLIALVVVLFVGSMSNRYTCTMKLKEIDKLERELKDVRFEALSISSELTGNSRQSQIELLIEEQGIDLGAAQNPPYILHK